MRQERRCVGVWVATMYTLRCTAVLLCMAGGVLVSRWYCCTAVLLLYYCCTAVVPYCCTIAVHGGFVGFVRG